MKKFIITPGMIMMNMGIEEFVSWLNQELESRGWSYSELARRADVSQSMVSKVMSFNASPGLDFCIGIANAFHTTTETVLRKAGILPSLPYDQLEDMNLKELYDLMRNLTPRDRLEVMEYARLRYRLLQEEHERKKGKNES